ncbi:MAG: cyclase family protein [Pyrinomonadaceae bacterium]
MKVVLDDCEFSIDAASAIDISIPMRFDGPQPNAYGVEPATSSACEYGSLIGDTRRGGSCNFERVTIIPHCNGTHTESVGHITDERISVRECLRDVFLRAVLVSVTPSADDRKDLVITEDALAAAVEASRDARSPAALVVRTLPNDASKLSRTYDESNIPAYFSDSAMEYMVECRFEHLLVDLPSVDRLYDEGKLANHRIFWNVEPGSLEPDDRTRMNSTITELIYVPNHVADGEYLLNLQIAPWDSDAAPSRPILFPTKDTKDTKIRSI